MKVLIVCSGNSGKISPFILDQAESLERNGLIIDYYLIKGKGILGYLKNYSEYKKKIKEFKPNIIHAHYGFSGLLATLQRKIPVVITFHGSDINLKRNLVFSFLASKLSMANIYVHPSQPYKIRDKKQAPIIPCGVNVETFLPIEKQTARLKLGLEMTKKYGLFSSHFDNPIKNYPLAKQAIASLLNDEVRLVELKNFTRDEVNLLMNAVDFLLVTSFSETGPLVVKEAMACNIPIVSTDVGDVRWLFGDYEGHFITSYNVNNVAENIKRALEYSKVKKATQGRQRIMELDLESESIAKRLIAMYNKIVKI